MKAYVVVACDEGTTNSISSILQTLIGNDHGSAKIVSSERVMGPYDMVAVIEGENDIWYSPIR